MPTTVNYNNSKTYDPTDNRPYGEVILTNGAGTVRSQAYTCLVDTGSDFVILPEDAAIDAGIVLTGATKTLRLATGAGTFKFEQKLDVVIEGYKIKADVLFDPSKSAAFVPILGRTAMLAAFDLGLDVNGWMWT